MSNEKNMVSKLENQDNCKDSSLLDLPEWILDCILELLSPLDLCRVAQVCTFLRYRSSNDALWEKKVQQKWGRVLGDVAHQEWQWHTTKMITESFLLQKNQSGSCGSFSGVWPFLSFHSYLENFIDFVSLSKNCSKMALYVCLESGHFWFPVQVYKQVANLFCYDAIVSYDSRTDTFRARSPTGGWRMIEENVEWERLRVSPVETSARDFYMSNCMNDLKPGDQIEIQMRRRKEFPYDWWYAVVGHLESCDEDVNHCHCQYSDMLVVEFKQYRPEHRWRRSMLNRNVYEEQGTRLRWFGGIRKLDKEEEIERWNNLFAS
ncbi:F-box protein At2g26850-like [Abrus precatorius]|uniref:F-box protein At2g26850-like n=1 Tax=Abrus precatorius TaxID=3816 RepID=A0A8B8L6T8_ABRPR|nr:F-box protein At2g26850-like [Abrus precatorius]